MNRKETKGFCEPRGKGGRAGDFDGQRTMTGTDHTDQGHGAEPQPKRLIHRFQRFSHIFAGSPRGNVYQNNTDLWKTVPKKVPRKSLSRRAGKQRTTEALALRRICACGSRSHDPLFFCSNSGMECPGTLVRMYWQPLLGVWQFFRANSEINGINAGA